jgi:hypothetical protein
MPLEIRLDPLISDPCAAVCTNGMQLLSELRYALSYKFDDGRLWLLLNTDRSERFLIRLIRR